MKTIFTFTISIILSSLLGGLTSNALSQIAPIPNLLPQPFPVIPKLQFTVKSYQDGCRWTPPEANKLSFRLEGVDFSRVESIEAYYVYSDPLARPHRFLLMRRSYNGPYSAGFKPFTQGGQIRVEPREPGLIRVTLIAKDRMGRALANTQIDTGPLEGAHPVSSFRPVGQIFGGTSGSSTVWFQRVRAQNVYRPFATFYASGDQLGGRTARLTNSAGIRVLEVGDTAETLLLSVARVQQDSIAPRKSVRFSVTALPNPLDECLINPNPRVELPSVELPLRNPPTFEPEPDGTYRAVSCQCSNVNATTHLGVQACLSATSNAQLGAALTCGILGSNISGYLRVRTSCAFSEWRTDSDGRACSAVTGNYYRIEE
jgi:hypothetical protein